MKTACALITGAALFAALNCLAEVKIEEQVVGPAYDQSTKYYLSPKGLHLATVQAKGSRFVVIFDGVEGPPYDEILSAAVVDPVVFNENNNATITHVTFSPDGTRFAYAARTGKEIIVVVDGKEIHRAPQTRPPAGYSSLEDPVYQLAFTPDGKHVMWLAVVTELPKEYIGSLKQDLMGYDRIRELKISRLMIDGKPASPPFIQTVMRFPTFNADSSRWVLLAGRPGSDASGWMLIMDGKDLGDPGSVAMAGKLDGFRNINYSLPRFTPDGKRLVSLRRDPKTREEQLLVDGKPLLSSSEPINGFYLSARGDIAAVATDRDGKRRLFINGKAQAGTEHALHINMVVGGTDNYRPVVFSADGSRWAVVCGDGDAKWVVVDGKKQIEYKEIRDLKFTPDGSRCVYGAEVAGASGSAKFLVIDGEEFRVTDFDSDTYKPLFSQKGGRVAYQTAMPGSVMKRQLYLDGKPLSEVRDVRSFTFSPDGSRYAYFNVSDPLGNAGLVINGEVVAKAGGGGAIVFSDDSQHIATIASPPKGGGAMFCVDGEFLPVPKGMQYPQILAFTADHRNLLIVGAESGPQTGNTRTYYLNGTRVAQFSAQAVSSFGTMGQPPPWELQPDGSVLFIGAEPTGLFGGQMKRIKATPESDTTIATWIADVAAAAEKAKADKEAEAARKKEEYEAAQAKKKADYEAAVAKRKAEQEARRRELENQRRAKQGLPPLPEPETAP
jgi:WD40 repeat protein